MVTHAARVDGAAHGGKGLGRGVRGRAVGLARPDRGVRGGGAQPARDRRAAPPADAGPRAVPARPLASGCATRAARSRDDISAPLRPRQRAVRADARRDDDVLQRACSSAARCRWRRRRARSSSGCAGSSTCGPSDQVLEIGTGWGGFALHAASTRGCRVTTTTISREQREYASARVRAAGAGGPRHGARRRLPRAARQLRQARLDRDDRGGRLEGLRHVLRSLRRAAAPDGAMLLQAITIDDRALRGREGVAVVHPHAHLPERLPALAGGDRPLRRAPDRHADRRSRGHHAALRGDAAALARELRGGAARGCWSSATTSASSGCGGCTCAYCEAGFAARRICDVQMVLAKPRWRGRAGAYARRRGGAGGGRVTLLEAPVRAARVHAGRERRAARAHPRPRGGPADVGSGAGVAGGRARRDRGRPAGVRRVARRSRRRARSIWRRRWPLR